MLKYQATLCLFVHIEIVLILLLLVLPLLRRFNPAEPVVGKSVLL
jgi:hypothetical protein